MWSLLRQYIWVADILGIVLCAYFLANLAGLYLEGKLQVTKTIGMIQEAEVGKRELPTKPRAYYDVINQRNIFDSTATPVVEAKKEATAELDITGEAVKTSLGINVLGVLVVGEGRDPRSSATVSSGKGKADVSAVGEVNIFAPDTKLIMVTPSRIEFINKGRLEYAEVTTDFGKSIFGGPDEVVVAATSTSTGGADIAVKAESPGKYTIDQAEVENALTNLDKLYTEIRAVPNFSGGKVSGMKILSVKRGSIFSKLGLKRGDILKRINGMELDVRRGFQIFSQLKDQTSFNLDLTRRGQPVTLEYDVR